MDRGFVWGEIPEDLRNIVFDGSSDFPCAFEAAFAMLALKLLFVLELPRVYHTDVYRIAHPQANYQERNS